MFPDFNNPIFQDEIKAREWLEAEQVHQGPQYGRTPWLIYVQCLPLTVHGDRWNAYGAQQNPAHQMALCNLFTYVIEEGSEHSTVA